MHRVLYHFSLLAFVPLAIATLSGCDTQKHQVPSFSIDEKFPGGLASSNTKAGISLEQPSATLAPQQHAEFYAGRALANQPWVIAPTITTARDGLGPYFHQRTCLACHSRGGKGDIPEKSSQLLDQAVVRLSIPAINESQIGPQPDPVYGVQLQPKSTSVVDRLALRNRRTDLPAEAKIYLQWSSKAFTYPDGQVVMLRRPQLDIRQLGYGPLATNIQTSLRAAPSIQGMGLIEAIPQAAIDQLADPDDQDRDGISGRLNWVTDHTADQTNPVPLVPGRFGLKANIHNLEQAVAAAFHQDLGITTPNFPQQTCTQLQTACQQQPNGNDHPPATESNKNASDLPVEVPQHVLNLVTNYITHLAVPARQEASLKATKQGRKLFYQQGCGSCHQPSFKTVSSGKNPELHDLTIYPYSDFLLHDMGDELADHRADFSASGREWRTAPLWSAGLHKRVNGNQFYLHDGRARNIEEAVLWHGGEADQSRQNFIQLSSNERRQLIQFVRSL